ncbi:MAG: glycosyltransferase [Proteobacteria bacterium]|nr:MAG: glycosyltransferase [Pseudomonadota bacterium]
MKICLNSCWFSFDCPGGGEVQFLNTKAALEKQGLDIALYNQWMPQLHSFDLIHFFTVQQGMASFCEYVKSLALPLVLSPIYWPPAGASRGEMWEIEKMLRLADRILPNSKAEADLLAQTFDIASDKFSVIPNGIPSDFTSKPTELNLFTDRYRISTPYFITVGNIEPRKNQLRVLKNLSILNSAPPLVCIGNIRDQNYFEECRSYGQQFIYIPPMDYGSQLLKSAVSSSVGFILLSLFETPGLAAMEAAALGVPLAITSRGSAKEYFGPSALYADPENDEQILTTLRALMKSDFQFPRWSSNDFTWDTVATKTNAVYRDVLRYT